jgi:D-alanine-D-alanine ligase-like ATP-grasp enzyme
MFQRHATAEMLFAEAERRGLAPAWESRDGLFSCLHEGKRRHVYYTKLHGNSQLGSQICTDKSLTRAFLACEGFPNIPWCHTKQKAELNRFFDEHHPLIQKPLVAMRSHGVRLIQARNEMQLDTLEDTIFERYIEGTEYRCLVMGGAVVAQQKKVMAPTEAHPWKKHVTNLPEGEWLSALKRHAESIAALLHMRCIAVDFIVDEKGEAWILELNGMPGLHSFHHPDAGESLNIAAKLIDSILSDE